MYPVELTGPRLLLREISLDDLDAAFDMASDPEWARWLPVEPVESKEAEVEILQRMMTQAREDPRIQYHLAVILRASGEMVGTGRIGITPKQHRAADIGYSIRRAFWNRGYATEAASLLVSFGFESLAMHRVWATHHPENLASARVLERVGMVGEGRIRDHHFAHGVWRDSICLSILEHEWQAATDQGSG